MANALGSDINNHSKNNNQPHVNATSFPSSAFDKTHSVWNQKLHDF